MSDGKKAQGRIFKAGDICKGGRYKIFDLLGAGGMGEVWTAFDERAADYDHQWVAVKVLQSKLGFDDESKRRLEREGSTLLNIQHPNLVRVLHVDIDEERNLFFYVMELLDGETLDAMIKRTRGLDLDEALRVCADVLDAVHLLHLLGIIHRDLKPENIFITKTGRVVVLDLGVAKFDPRRFPDRATQPTGPGVILGTCAYMSPEQCLADPLDARSDVYAVGLIAYASLFGAHAAKAGRTGEIPQDYKQWAGWHLHQRPRPLTDVLPWLDHEVWEVIAKALSKDPGDRHGSAAELSSVLHGVRVSQKAKGNARPPGERAAPGGSARPARPDPAAMLPLATTEESEVRSSPAAAALVPVVAASPRASQPAPRGPGATLRPSQPPRSAGRERGSEPPPRSLDAAARPSEPAPSAAPETPAPRTSAGTEIITLGPASPNPHTARGTEIIRVAPLSRAQAAAAEGGPKVTEAGTAAKQDAETPPSAKPTEAGKRRKVKQETGASQSTPVTHDVPVSQAKGEAASSATPVSGARSTIAGRRALAFAGGGVAVGLAIAGLVVGGAGLLRSDPTPAGAMPPAVMPPAVMPSGATTASSAQVTEEPPAGAPSMTATASAVPLPSPRPKVPARVPGGASSSSAAAVTSTSSPATAKPKRPRLPTNPGRPPAGAPGTLPKSDRIVD